MKNIINTISYSILITLLLLSANVYGQNVSDVTRDNGLVMHRDQSIGMFNFHRRAVDDFDFIYMRASDTSALNNIVVTDQGMMLIGVDDLCGGLVDLPPSMPNVKLFVDGGFEVAKHGSSLWSVVSDKRLKKNVKPLKKSLDILKKVDFVEYQYNGLAGTPADSKMHYGVLAQQVRKALPSTVSTYQNKVRSNDKKKTELLMFNPNDLFYTGLNAIKELAEKTEALEKAQKKNEHLERRVQDLEEKMSQIMNALNGQTSPVQPEMQLLSETQRSTYSGTARLFQNSPNPLNQSTNIKYYLPDDTNHAYIMIHDVNGQLVKQFNLTHSGEGEVTFNALQNELTGGTYVYTLYADGNKVDSRKMMLLTK